jgi:hypothetical protein
MQYPCRPTRRLNVLLLAALVHFVNACPCGCLQRNGIYQAFVSVVPGDVGSAPPHGPSSPDGPADVESAHCHSHSDLLFATGTGVVPPHDSAMPITYAPNYALQAIESAAPRGEHLRSLASANPALGVCAELKVLLI